MVRLEANHQDVTIWPQAIAIHPINNLGLTPFKQTTLHCCMLRPSSLWVPSHISPHLEFTTFANSYVHIETKITTNSKCQSFLVACLVKWVSLILDYVMEARSKKWWRNKRKTSTILLCWFMNLHPHLNL
jgi:hypothetical protein